MLPPLQVSHVCADPLDLSQLAALPMARFRSVLILDDDDWRDTARPADISTAVEAVGDAATGKPGMLRQDAVLLTVQVRRRNGVPPCTKVQPEVHWAEKGGSVLRSSRGSSFHGVRSCTQQLDRVKMPECHSLLQRPTCSSQ